MPASPSASLRNIQLLRAIAVLMVVAFHVEPYLLKLNIGYERWVDRFGYSGVDLFFVISGFINSYVSIPHFGERGYSWRFISKRLVRIVPNYWVILLPTTYLVYEHGLRPTDTVDPLISYLLLVPQHLTDHIMIPAWTLNYELYFYMALAVLMLRPQLILPVGGLCFIAVAIAQYWLDYSNVVFAWAFALSPYWLQFIAGMWIGVAARRGVMPLAGFALLFGGVMFGVAVYVNTVIYPEGFANPFHRDLRAWLYLLSYAPIVYALVALEQQGGWQCRNRWLIAVGDASYSLYLWMTPFLFVFHHTVMYLLGSWMPKWASYAIYIPAMMLSLVIFSLTYYQWVERPMLRYLNRKLTG